MVAPKWKGRRKSLKKNWGIPGCVILVGILLTCLSCNNTGTNSTSSSSATSGTGTGWTISIQIGTNPLPFGGTTAIVAIVRDRTGAPAPFGTLICTTVVKNGLLKPGATDLFATICEPTLNNLGQTIQTYSASLTTGIDTIEVSSQGVIARATLTVN
jgi:hypothetical protein